MDLFVFTTEPALVRQLVPAGAAGVIVDWERRGKDRRQAGEGTQINDDSPADLAAVRAATEGRVLCRINAAGPWTRHEVDLAVRLGADEVLLPMVRRPDEVDRALTAARGRCGVGILIETQAAVDRATELCDRPLSRVYLGLNDLRIDRRSTDLFRPLVDGTVDLVSAASGRVSFGAAGLTLPDCGAPVPSRLLSAELVRAGAAFTFLRRSFLADVRGRDLTASLDAMHLHLAAMAARTPEQVADHRTALADLLDQQPLPAVPA